MCTYSTEEEDLLTCLSDDHKSAIFLQKAVVELLDRSSLENKVVVKL